MKQNLMYIIYIPVFLLYTIFFIIFVAILIVPNSYFSYLLFYGIINGLYYLYPILLIPLGVIIGLIFLYIRTNIPFERKQIWRILITPLIIIAIFIIIYLLLNWMVPTYWIIFRAYGFD